MISFRAIRPLLLTFLLAVLAGCGTSSFRLTVKMQPVNVATVRVTGARPFVLIKNQGPGSVDVTFDTGIASDREKQTLSASATTGRTLSGSTVVTVTTGSDEPAVVRIEAQRASGLRLHGPLPK